MTYRDAKLPGFGVRMAQRIPFFKINLLCPLHGQEQMLLDVYYQITNGLKFEQKSNMTMHTSLPPA